MAIIATAIGTAIAAILSACLPVLLKYWGDKKKEKEADERKIETAPDSPAVRLERLRQRVLELSQTKPPAKP